MVPPAIYLNELMRRDERPSTRRRRNAPAYEKLTDLAPLVWINIGKGIRFALDTKLMFL